MIQPILLLGYGNPSRGDDAVGPLLLEAIAEQIDPTQVELITDFQLQIEHALDMQHRQLVLFIDASVACETGFSFTELYVAKDNSYSTHAISPAAVLDVYQTVNKQSPPASFLLTIQAQQFELGSGLSELTTHYFKIACELVIQLLKQPQLKAWRALATK
ncbi:MAG: hydrogenase maturation protease [Methylomonas sp.]